MVMKYLYKLWVGSRRVESVNHLGVLTLNAPMPHTANFTKFKLQILPCNLSSIYNHIAMLSRSSSSLVRASSRILAQRAIVSRPCAAVAMRFNSTDAAAPVDPKISAIVDQISSLTILETSALVSELKSRLNIPDIAFPAAGAAPAAAAAAPAEAEAAAEPVEEKTMFNIKLESIDAKSKPKIIKEIKNLLGLSLVESKKFVESAPKMLKENVNKEDAEKIKQAIEAAGGKIALE